MVFAASFFHPHSLGECTLTLAPRFSLPQGKSRAFASVPTAPVTTKMTYFMWKSMVRPTSLSQCHAQCVRVCVTPSLPVRPPICPSESMCVPVTPPPPRLHHLLMPKLKQESVSAAGVTWPPFMA